MVTVDPGIDPAKAHEIAYVKPGSMRLTVEHNLFLYRTVKRVRKQSSSSSSSGSSRNTGGGSF